MTKKGAKRYICAVMADETRHHLGNGSKWLFQDDEGNDHSVADQVRLNSALLDLADELDRRGSRA